MVHYHIDKFYESRSKRLHTRLWIKKGRKSVLWCCRVQVSRLLWYYSQPWDHLRVLKSPQTPNTNPYSTYKMAPLCVLYILLDDQFILAGANTAWGYSLNKLLVSLIFAGWLSASNNYLYNNTYAYNNIDTSNCVIYHASRGPCTKIMKTISAINLWQLWSDMSNTVSTMQR